MRICVLKQLEVTKSNIQTWNRYCINFCAPARSFRRQKISKWWWWSPSAHCTLISILVQIFSEIMIFTFSKSVGNHFELWMFDYVSSGAIDKHHGNIKLWYQIANFICIWSSIYCSCFDFWKSITFPSKTTRKPLTIMNWFLIEMFYLCRCAKYYTHSIHRPNDKTMNSSML